MELKWPFFLSVVLTVCFLMGEPENVVENCTNNRSQETETND